MSIIFYLSMNQVCASSSSQICLHCPSLHKTLWMSGEFSLCNKGDDDLRGMARTTTVLIF